MDLLLDVNVAVDSCVGRKPWCQWVDLALAKCTAEGGRLWLYAGSVQTLDYVTRNELRRTQSVGAAPPSARQLEARAKALLAAFTADKQWLAALAGEGPVFDCADSEDEQLLRALDRFAPGSIKLLTRDERLLEHHRDRTISPEAYCREPLSRRSMHFVDLETQQAAIRPELERNLHRVLHHGQYILGPEVRELEARLAAYTGAKHVITVASGTEALLISLMALGIGPGDEVITTPFTFVATVEVIVLVGATPVFVDIDPATGNIDAALIEARITDKTKAIMPVSLYGQPADMDAINAIAARHGPIPVIEDAAQSFGATYKGKKSGNLSTLGCTSFFPSKPLGCYGDGGAIFTSDDSLAQACREIRVHGQSARYVHTRVGVGGRMDSLQCAVVLAKLDRFDEEIAQRQAVARRYQDLLATEELGRTRTTTDNKNLRDVPASSVAQEPPHVRVLPCSSVAREPPHVRVLPCSSVANPLPWPKEDRTSVFAQYSLLVADRAPLQAKLQAAGIPTAVHYPIPLNEQPAYAHLAGTEGTPIAAQIARQILCLPMHADLSEAEQRRIVATLLDAMD
ncbi:DegT/DnrJ/EryC1/StrS family aminotransferase [Thioalkalicoccus limnaeus]|uniref:DegT/DnrJ/EryC1/StrS family aminotransferase n=1 Tax=Thioalkalicoccus limnaeus TaxID=120681 RepID=A0ABV4BKK6_9GAMM